VDTRLYRGAGTPHIWYIFGLVVRWGVPCYYTRPFRFYTAVTITSAPLLCTVLSSRLCVGAPRLRYLLRLKLGRVASIHRESEKESSQKVGFRYSPFSETGLPVLVILGNTATKGGGRKTASPTCIRLGQLSTATCPTSDAPLRLAALGGGFISEGLLEVGDITGRKGTHSVPSVVRRPFREFGGLSQATWVAPRPFDVVAI
jgi:hypothetical protein